MLLRKRYPYWYIERCTIFRKDHQIIVQSKNDIMEVPLTQIGFMLVGPGCNISSNAISHIAKTGGHLVTSSSAMIPTAIVSTSGRYGNAKIAKSQAAVCSSEGKRLSAARALFLSKFPDAKANLSSISRTRDIFGIEGPIMRQMYRDVFGSSFRRVRECGGDVLNHKINVLYNSFYSLVFVACQEWGLSPHLGLIHGEKRNSFVYDLADLFKTKNFLELSVKEDSIKNVLLASSRMHHVNRSWELLEKVIINVFNLDQSDLAQPQGVPKTIEYKLYEESHIETRDVEIED